MYEQPSQKPYGLLIRIDDEVLAKLNQLRDPGESYRDVLRRVFGLEPAVDRRKKDK